jgi:hypothetical protein
VDPAALLLRLDRAARYWHRRYAQRLGTALLEPSDLVAEGWLAWSRSGSWTRAEGAIRDALRLAWQRRQREPERDGALRLAPGLYTPRSHAPRRSLALPPAVALAPARDQLLLAAIALGRPMKDVAAELGLSRGRTSVLARRALRRLEGQRIAARRRGRPLLLP